jgi:hypothetical protein
MELLENMALLFGISEICLVSGFFVISVVVAFGYAAYVNNKRKKEGQNHSSLDKVGRNNGKI